MKKCLNTVPLQAQARDKLRTAPGRGVLLDPQRTMSQMPVFRAGLVWL